MGAPRVAWSERRNNPLSQERRRLSGLFSAMSEQAEEHGVKRYHDMHRTLKQLGMPSPQVDVIFGRQLPPGQRRDSLRRPVSYELVIAKLEQNQTSYWRFKSEVGQPLDAFFAKEQSRNQDAAHYQQTCLNYAARVQLVDQHLHGRLTDFISSQSIDTLAQRSQAVLGITLSLGQYFQTEYDKYQRTVIGSLGINITGRPHS